MDVKKKIVQWKCQCLLLIKNAVPNQNWLIKTAFEEDVPCYEFLKVGVVLKTDGLPFGLLKNVDVLMERHFPVEMSMPLTCREQNSGLELIN